MLKVKVFATPREWSEDDVRGTTAIVIDVLRASSTIIQAISNGAREVVPVTSPAEAGEFAIKAGRSDLVLGGERDGKLIEGFDLGNSPFEYTPERIGGRTIVFASTNGAPALVRCKTADHVLVAGFNNFSSAVAAARGLQRDVSIICSGRHGKFSLEDFVCAGKIVEGVSGPGAAQDHDGSQAALDLFRYYRSQIREIVRSCFHGRYLASIGYADDLDHCAKVDSHQVVPVLIEGKIRLPKTNGST